MRVIRTEGSDQEDWTPRLCTHDGSPYATLSHRWLVPEYHEILFADIEEVDRVIDALTPNSVGFVVKNQQYAGTPPSAKPAFGKVKGAARQALKAGIGFVWIDTCCIDKSSSAELSEAINSMWKWYASSVECYVYLADVPDATGQEQHDLFAKSQWWTRGWTLQELLAPRELTFYSSTWTAIGQKKYMDMAISEITGIDPNVVNGTMSLDNICVAQRMSWGSARVTSRVEDLAYALMGLFSVNMPLLYGEGEKSFLRLQEEIMKDSDDESIFAWRDDLPNETYSGLLASRPSAFASCRRTVRYQDGENRPSYNMTNKGLSITLPMQKSSSGLYRAILHCADPNAGYQHVRIYLAKTSSTSHQYARVRCKQWATPSTSSDTVLQTIFVKQSHDQSPAYKKLSGAGSTIRLLRVVPTADPADLRCMLMEANIKTSRYTAVSHVWAPPGDEKIVKINSDVFSVQKRVYDILQAARREPKGELFWIDSICIHQYDQREVHALPEIMADIYSSAKDVLAADGLDLNVLMSE